MKLRTLVATVPLTGSLVNVASPSSPTMTLPAWNVTARRLHRDGVGAGAAKDHIVATGNGDGVIAAVARIFRRDGQNLARRAERRLAVVADDGVVATAERNRVAADTADRRWPRSHRCAIRAGDESSPPMPSVPSVEKIVVRMPLVYSASPSSPMMTLAPVAPTTIVSAPALPMTTLLPSPSVIVSLLDVPKSGLVP